MKTFTVEGGLLTAVYPNYHRRVVYLGRGAPRLASKTLGGFNIVWWRKGFHIVGRVVVAIGAPRSGLMFLTDGAAQPTGLPHFFD